MISYTLNQNSKKNKNKHRPNATKKTVQYVQKTIPVCSVMDKPP